MVTQLENMDSGLEIKALDLIHFRPVFSFYTPENIRKLEVSFIFPEVIEREHWPEMG